MAQSVFLLSRVNKSYVLALWFFTIAILWNVTKVTMVPGVKVLFQSSPSPSLFSVFCIYLFNCFSFFLIR